MPEKGLPKDSPSFGRLKEALEKLPGREKYRAATRSPSDGQEVRWYFSNASLPLQEVAACIPTTEVVEKGDFLRFSVNDSLVLEAAFLEQEEELVSAWWKEYAECTEGPLGSTSKQGFSSLMPDANGSKSTHSGKNEDMNGDDAKLIEKQVSELDDSDNIIGVCVKGGLHEVDLLRRRCYPVYWTGDHRRVLRGHWFAQKGGLDWLPIREDVSEQLESAYWSQIWHRRTFQPSGRFAARINLQGSAEGLHALFTGEDDTWEAWLNVDTSVISLLCGIWGNGIRLRRGFAPPQSSQPTQDELKQQEEEKKDDYCSQVPVRHLVFMVHGIGQRLENANLVDDVSNFRHLCMTLAEQHLTAYQRNSQRVLFIPCQWRKGLKLSGEEAVESCTLEGVRALRTMLSATVHDVLYYMSPVYCQEIIDSVIGQLNRLYCKFIKRNPGYNGKVSVYGHSLGSVLSYDILCHQNHLKGLTLMSQMSVESQDSGTQVSGKKRLQKVEDHLEKNTNLSCEDQYIKDGDDSKHRHSTGHSSWPDDVAEYIEKLSLSREYDIMKSTDEVISPHSIGTGERIIKENAVDYLGDGGTHKQHTNSRKHYTPFIEYSKLSFEVDTFFAVGSPLGVFLSLRNVRLGIGGEKKYWEDEGIDEEMPSCRRLLNIFHPFDPVAYRLEPLVCKEFIQKQPVFVPYHRGGRRLHIGMQELRKDLRMRSKAFVDLLTAFGDQLAQRIFPNPGTGDDKNLEPQKERTYGAMVMERLTGSENGRIDYMLQDATFEHAYLQAISSHTAYWRDPDTALFVIKQLYSDIPEEDPNPQPEDVIESGETSTSNDLMIVLNQDFIADEGVDFTFAVQTDVISC